MRLAGACEDSLVINNSEFGISGYKGTILSYCRWKETAALPVGKIRSPTRDSIRIISEGFIKIG
jgi:hypothetical protein